MPKNRNAGRVADSFASETQRELAQLRKSLRRARTELTHLRRSLRGIAQIRPPRRTIPATRAAPVSPFISGIADYFAQSLVSDDGLFQPSRTQIAGQLLDAAQRGQRIR